jgi:hypothetical protein
VPLYVFHGQCDMGLWRFDGGGWGRLCGRRARQASRQQEAGEQRDGKGTHRFILVG